jgi:hypothetical protein
MDAHPNLRMLSSAEDAVQVGHWIVVPNLPEYGCFHIAEVTGGYNYDPLRLSEANGINGLQQDYGHVLPVKLLTPRGINKYAEVVDARIRSTLRTPMRMWNMDRYGPAIERLVAASQSGADCLAATSGEARLSRAWKIARDHAAEQFRERLAPELDARFQAAEWEAPIASILRRLHPGADVRPVGGRSEEGADIIVQFSNHFGGTHWLIVVQVKNYDEEINALVLEQLRRAYKRYSADGKLLALVVMTTAERASEDLNRGARDLERELGIPVKLILRREMMKLLADGLMGTASA